MPWGASGQLDYVDSSIAEEVERMRISLAADCHKNVRAGDFALARSLNMQNGILHNALKTARRHCLDRLSFVVERRSLVVHMFA